MASSDKSQRYILLAAVGETPEIITEIIWALSDKNPENEGGEAMLPEKVIALTTLVGKKYIEHRLQGKHREEVRKKKKSCLEKWIEFEDMLQEKIEIGIRVAGEDNGKPVEDLRERSQDDSFAKLSYRCVHELTKEDDVIPEKLPVVGCVAGGRKTMGLHMATAFCLFGRGIDRLYHVLVDEKTEEEKDFFWPKQRDLNREGFRLDLVDAGIPKLRVLLRQGVQEGYLQDLRERLDEKAIEDIRDVLNAYSKAEGTPSQIVINVDKSSKSVGQLWLCGEHGRIGKPCDLEPNQLVTLLILLAHRDRHDEVHWEDLKDTDKQRRDTHEQRKYLTGLLKTRDRPHVIKEGDHYPTRKPLKRWDENEDISRAGGNLKERTGRGGLKTIPAIWEHLKFESDKSESGDSVWVFERRVPKVRLEVVDMNLDEQRWEELLPKLPLPISVPYRSKECN